ncbi:MAG: helix-turn-helix domain-containing protein [Candidatus Ornithomonoglobus sp.]
MADMRKNISDYISENGIMKKHVAERSHIELSKLSLILSGKRNLMAEEYVSICDALNVPYDYFVSNMTHTVTKPA